ncbi:MAG: hypothetical protein DMG05_29005 [Acidobacteria bacterium]|nr:MAG: hypothetical protein DMG05_29005 [Acidobacteriota bacterium]
MFERTNQLNVGAALRAATLCQRLAWDGGSHNQNDQGPNHEFETPIYRGYPSNTMKNMKTMKDQNTKILRTSANRSTLKWIRKPCLMPDSLSSKSVVLTSWTP